MKTTDNFKRVIQAYLEQRAEYDALFAHSYRNPNKSLDECITYILNTVRNSGCNGYTDDEIFSLSLHYFDETDIEVGNPIDCKIVINHTVELTDEEKFQARRDAVKRIENEAYARMTKSKSRTIAKPAATVTTQKTLFDL